MSDISLNANVYQVSKRYYNMIIQFVHHVEETSGAIDPKDRNELKNLFSDLLNQESNDPQIQMLWIIINRALRLRNRSLNDVAKRIVEDLEVEQIVSQETIQSLEYISKALDNERAVALTRMTRS